MIFKPYDYTLRYEGFDYACRRVDISPNVKITKFVEPVEPYVWETNEGIGIYSSLYGVNDAMELSQELILASQVLAALERWPMAEEIEL